MKTFPVSVETREIEALWDKIVARIVWTPDVEWSLLSRKAHPMAGEVKR